MADYDLAIIGAGMAGASLAAEVAPHARVLLLEAEERHHKGAVAALRAQLEPLGYTGYMLQNGVLTGLSSFDPAIHQALSGISEEALNRGHVPEGYVNNFVFLPQ